jgi:hypothetical protein
MRVLRGLLGVVGILVALPLLLGGVALWAAMQHRAPDGAFTASLSSVRSGGYAIVVPDIDALLRREAPFVRGGSTGLRLVARTQNGPAFIGLGPRRQVGAYLDGVPRTNVTDVRLARGGLPVAVMPVPGTMRPATRPAEQKLWIARGNGSLSWQPDTIRDRAVSLVVMAPDAQAPVELTATAAVIPEWLDPTTWGLLILGTIIFVLGMVALFWPRRQREIVYVVEPSQVPEIAARLGFPTESLLARGTCAVPQARSRPAPGEWPIPPTEPMDPPVLVVPQPSTPLPASAPLPVSALPSASTPPSASISPPAWAADQAEPEPSAAPQSSAAAQSPAAAAPPIDAEAEEAPEDAPEDAPGSPDETQAVIPQPAAPPRQVPFQPAESPLVSISRP